MDERLPPKAEEIADGRWAPILQAAGLGAYLSKKHGPCPFGCIGPNGGRPGGVDRFRFFNIDDGRWICNVCGVGGGFQLLQHVLGTDFRGAADFVRSWAGITPGAFQPRADLPAPVRERTELTVEELDKLQQQYVDGLRASKPITEDTAAWRYLKMRVPQLTIGQVPKVLRAVPALEYWEPLPHEEAVRTKRRYRSLGKYPAMYAAVHAPDGQIVNVWRWYLTEAGLKAPVPNPKKGWSKFVQASYAVRLERPSEQLGVCEGVETGLAVRALHKLPTWATLSADGMRKFELPEKYRSVRVVYIYRDNDRPDQNGRRAGNDAAEELRRKLLGQGIRAFIRSPMSTAYDFADINVKAAQVHPA